MGSAGLRTARLPSCATDGLHVAQMPQAASIMAVPDADPQYLEQLPPQDAEQPVGAAGLLTATAEREEDMVHPGKTGDAPPVGAAAKDNAVPDKASEQPGVHCHLSN